MDWKFVLALIFAVIIAVFAIQNAEAVDINFLLMDGTMSQALVILISAMLGAIIVAMLGLIRWVRLASKIKGSSKSIAALEDENNKLTSKNEELASKLEELTLKFEEHAVKADSVMDIPIH